MPRLRKSNKNLPERVYVYSGRPKKNGVYPKPRYLFKPKKDGGGSEKAIFLGNSYAEMLRNYLQIIEKPKNLTTLGTIIDSFVQEVSCKRSRYHEEVIKANYLKSYFKDMYPQDLTAPTIYQYMDIRSEKVTVEKLTPKGKMIKVTRGGHVAANKERSMLYQICSYAIRKGLMTVNPVKDVIPFVETPRDRYPENWELKAVYDEGSEVLKCIIDFAYITGQRISDILGITEANLSEEGIHLIQAKSKHRKKPVRILIKWASDLRKCIDKAKKLRGAVSSIYLFSKDDGQQYSYSGFRSMYVRAMKKAIKKGILKETFTFHDLRAKVYTDEEDESARIARAGHTDGKMARVYYRKEKVVEPKDTWQKTAEYQ